MSTTLYTINSLQQSHVINSADELEIQLAGGGESRKVTASIFAFSDHNHASTYSVLGHTHISSDITNATASNVPNMIVKRDENGIFWTEGIHATTATLINLVVNGLTVINDLTATITSINLSDIDLTEATIGSLWATTATIDNLDATMTGTLTGIFDGHATGTASLTTATIGTLVVGDLSGSFTGTFTGTASLTQATITTLNPTEIIFNNTNSLSWVAGYNTAQIRLLETEYNKIGFDLYEKIWNETGSVIPRGSVVMFSSSTNDIFNGIIALNSPTVSSTTILGVAVDSVLTGNYGFVKTNGIIENIDTTGGAEVWAVGDPLYLNPALAGSLTKYVPDNSSMKNIIAYVFKVGALDGKIQVKIDSGNSITNLSEVSSTNATTFGEMLVWNGTYYTPTLSVSLSAATISNIYGTFSGVVLATVSGYMDGTASLSSATITNLNSTTATITNLYAATATLPNATGTFSGTFSGDSSGTFSGIALGAFSGNASGTFSGIALGTFSGEATGTFTGLSSGTGSFSTVTATSITSLIIAASIGNFDSIEVDNQTVNGVLTVYGDLIVAGSQVSGSAITDTIMVLNDGEAGAGVTTTFSGITIDRGSLDNSWLVFDEVSDTWKTGIGISSASVSYSLALQNTLAVFATVTTNDLNVNDLYVNSIYSGPSLTINVPSPINIVEAGITDAYITNAYCDNMTATSATLVELYSGLATVTTLYANNFGTFTGLANGTFSGHFEGTACISGLDLSSISVSEATITVLHSATINNKASENFVIHNAFNGDGKDIRLTDNNGTIVRFAGVNSTFYSNLHVANTKNFYVLGATSESHLRAIQSSIATIATIASNYSNIADLFAPNINSVTIYTDSMTVGSTVGATSIASQFGYIDSVESTMVSTSTIYVNGAPLGSGPSYMSVVSITTTSLSTTATLDYNAAQCYYIDSTLLLTGSTLTLNVSNWSSDANKYSSLQFVIKLGATKPAFVFTGNWLAESVTFVNSLVLDAHNEYVFRKLTNGSIRFSPIEVY